MNRLFFIVLFLAIGGSSFCQCKKISVKDFTIDTSAIAQGEIAFKYREIISKGVEDVFNVFLTENKFNICGEIPSKFQNSFLKEAEDQGFDSIELKADYVISGTIDYTTSDHLYVIRAVLWDFSKQGINRANVKLTRSQMDSTSERENALTELLGNLLTNFQNNKQTSDTKESQESKCILKKMKPGDYFFGGGGIALTGGSLIYCCIKTRKWNKYLEKHNNFDVDKKYDDTHDKLEKAKKYAKFGAADLTVYLIVKVAKKITKGHSFGFSNNSDGIGIVFNF